MTNKRADLTYIYKGEQNSIDVVVIATMKPSRPHEDPLKSQYTTKKRDYNRERTLHPIVFGSNGDVNSESWKYLSDLGFNIANLRDIQHIIIKHSSYKIQDAMNLNVKTWKQRDRNSRRRRNRSGNENKTNSKTKPKRTTILDYMD